jgi:hypothetical protein
MDARATRDPARKIVRLEWPQVGRGGAPWAEPGGRVEWPRADHRGGVSSTRGRGGVGLWARMPDRRDAV